MTIVTLCGSARFERQFKEASKHLTLMGYIVVGLGSYPSENDGEKDWYTPDQKELLDLVHFSKVERADCVLIIDHDQEVGQVATTGVRPHAYIGYSTAREVLYANIHDRPIILLSECTGWGHVAEIVEARFDEGSVDTKEAVARAQASLRREHGNKLIDEQRHVSHANQMRAGLSIIASQIVNTETGQRFAEELLAHLGHDPMDGSEVHEALASFEGLPSIMEAYAAQGGFATTTGDAGVDRADFPLGIQTELRPPAMGTLMISLPAALAANWRSRLYTARQMLETRGNRVKAMDVLHDIDDQMREAEIEINLAV